jgi:hypothetical protein
MKFLVDENVPQTIIKNLRNEGHDVLDVKKSQYHRAADTQLTSIAQRENRIIVTYDQDFLDDYSHPVPKIVIRLLYPDLEITWERLKHALNKYPVHKAKITIFIDRDEVWVFGS